MPQLQNTSVWSRVLTLKNLFWFYCIATVIASVHQYLMPQEGLYTNYNNYVIFKQSFFHLIHGQDLYALYPDECWDYYKYSPAFSLFFGLLAWLPDVVGLSLWNLLNALVLYYAVKTFPSISERTKCYMLLFVFLELLTNIQNAQSNGLIAGLLILAFNRLEKGDMLWAPLFIALTVFIKIFGFVGFALFLLYPQKPKFILYSALWGIALFAVPVVVAGINGLIMQYASWLNLLGEDHSASIGLSVMGWLQTWFGWEPAKNVIVLAGIALFCLPLIRISRYKDFAFRALLLASILLWVIIFNHKAESPTFIIAIAGVAVWYYVQKRNWVNTVLAILAFVFTSLSPTDIFPPVVRNQWVIPYVLKAVPCIFIWAKIIYETTFIKYTTEYETSV